MNYNEYKAQLSIGKKDRQKWGILNFYIANRQIFWYDIDILVFFMIDFIDCKESD